MGLDQRIWADIKVGDGKKQIAMHYWRKDYEIDDWFSAAYRKQIGRLSRPAARQRGYTRSQQ